jgi:hypothetical protein
MALMLWLIATALSGAAVAAEVSQSPDTGQIQELQRQIDALTKELATVGSGSDVQAQRNAMQSHWSMMQKYMGSVRQWPGMGPSGCSDWTMMDPSVMSGGMMGGGMMGHGTTGGCWDHGTGMMGPGMSGWALPNETPEQYQKRMQALQQDMRKQMTAIAAETDPAKRDALIRQHYDSMYRNMQTMRGMGWMWNAGTANALPDAGSPGATLESKYCSQCHAAPPPDVHTAKEWADVTGRMKQHIGDVSKSTGNVMVPNASELTTIVEYLDQHAKSGS